MPRRVVLLASSLVLAACGTDRPTAPTALLSAPVANTAENMWLLTGSGHTDLPVSGDMRNFTFHAKRNPDGSASGSYRLARHDIDVWFTVDVTCMSVVGNTAWVAGIISDTNAPGLILVGRVSYFFAIDGGEGVGTIDKISRARINDQAGQDAVFCALKPTAIFDPNPLTIVEGNVQLR